MRLSLLSLFLLTGCVTVPRNCQPLLPGGLDVSYFSGKCRKLIFHGEDRTIYCREEALLYEPDKTSRTLVFLSDNPHELFSFTGPPFSVDPNSLRFDVHRTIRAPRKALGSDMAGVPEKGACDFVVRDSKTYLIRCQSRNEKGKETLIEFATTDTRPLWCKEDFPTASLSPPPRSPPPLRPSQGGQVSL